jgi:hypothetical protein
MLDGLETILAAFERLRTPCTHFRAPHSGLAVQGGQSGG